MRRFIVCLAVAALLCALASCGHGENVAVTADTGIDVSGASAGVSLTEETAKELLGAYEPDLLGLEKPIEDYYLRLSATRVLEQDGCLVEAFETESEVENGTAAVGTFAIIGVDCYVYDINAGRYLLLTNSGAVVTAAATTTEAPTDEHGETLPPSPFTERQQEENETLSKRFSAYTNAQLGLANPPDTYFYTFAESTVTAADGATVYIVNLYELDGTPTRYTVAIGDKDDYAYDAQNKVYVAL